LIFARKSLRRLKFNWILNVGRDEVSLSTQSRKWINFGS
jgi:hypothetical protein